ncbi:leucine-rich repeat domain-containing protein [Prevotella sp.]|uniref:leucine-rich repeat domain-containing protein n=1 Tax=Prevotella sp. TaxID=59823 RepID=UPI002E781850|nr:leucine-rich repeat domain-containing protein [Prevotella sp.]MEE0671209.1 leucine-rich repeat domain-containing protein [Prevotella sp.]
MMKFLLSKHSRSIFIFALLSLFMCMAAGKASAAGLNPVVKIDKTSYTSSGTEVTLKLWMFNWKYAAFSPKQYNARFTGDVYLYIDDKEVANLNEMWLLISGSSYTFFKDEPGIVGKSSGINLDGTNVGTAQFQDFKSGQTCPYNSNTTEDSWSTVDLKISFNKSFSYYGHKITVKGKWQDQGSGTLVAKDVALDNDINGFVRPVNLSAQPSGDNMVFSWKQQGYNSSASTDGKWIVYKREGDNNVKLGEVAANEHSLSIEKKQYSCSKEYIMTFLPNACEGEETVCGLTTTIAGTGRFCYQTSDGNTVNISGKDFGAKVVSHKVVDGKCVIEFDAPITKIPAEAFFRCKNLIGNLVIPNSVTEIGDNAFYECTELKGDLTIPNSIKTIGTSAFYKCSGFTGDLTIPNSVKTIGMWAFNGCSGFTGNLTIPNSVKTIGNSAFSGCYGFTGKLTISDSVTTIGTSAFFNCFKFTGDLTIPNSVKTIGNRAFYNCYGFTGNLTIPNSVTTIGESAFMKCKGFTGDLTIPNSVTTIGNMAFQGCSGFTGKLTISNSVTTIGKLAFSNSGFTGDLSLPKSLEVVAISSFQNCKNIKTINFQSLPEGISEYLDDQKRTVSLSDDSYISDKASGTVNEISYTRKMSSDWGTLVLPYPLTLTGNKPYRLYTIENMNGDELVLKQLDKDVLAGTPCVVKRNGSETELTFGANKAALKMAIDDQPMDGMNFSGTYWTKDVTDGYIIAKDCFWNVAELNKSDLVKGVKVKPFRAWLDGTSPNGASQLSICVSDTATGIGAAGTIDVLNDTATEYYDLSGKRLDEPQRGVNIVRMKSGKTKKIIIK